MKLLRRTLAALFVLVGVQTASAQPICAFDHLQGKLLKQDSGFRKNILASETRIKEFIRKHPVSSNLRGADINAAPYIIPVVVHVVHTGGAVGTIYNPTDAQINGAIDYLNQVYNGTYPGLEGVGDLGVQFVLASRDTNCNGSTGIDRIDGSSLTNYAANGVNSSTSSGVSELTLKNFDRWDPNSFYNIWVVNKIDGKDGTSGQFVAGYAYFAGAPASLDGTIMLATQMKTGQKTLPHEIGHALALYHPFEGSPDAVTCPANANCNTDGDAICDTDPITYNQTGGVVNFSCRTGTNTCTGTPYSINTEKNFMNYTSCYTLFTAGQKARMQAAMSLPSRQSLVNSSATGSFPVSPYSGPIASCAPVTSPIGLTDNYAGIMSVTVASKTFNTSTASIDGGYVDKTAKCLNLLGLQRGNTYNYTVNLLGVNDEQLGIWIDYNNDGVFNNSTEQLYYNGWLTSPNPGVAFITVTGSFTVPATAAIATVLRMRVMDDVSTVYGFPAVTGCSNPSYGQAEDYAVYLSALLPVQLDYFNGIKKNEDAVLSWQTASEQNAKEFQVERSTNGIDFSFIGTVAASNLATGSVYTYTDKNIGTGNNYYRLKQVDRDMKMAVSNVVLVKSADNSNGKLRVMTNPFEDQLDLVFHDIQPGNSHISLFDITGKKILSKNYKVSSGQSMHIDVSGLGLKPGVYILQAQVGAEIMTQKVIKQ
jgi:hypothetical protein